MITQHWLRAVCALVIGKDVLEIPTFNVNVHAAATRLGATDNGLSVALELVNCGCPTVACCVGELGPVVRNGSFGSVTAVVVVLGLV